MNTKPFAEFNKRTEEEKKNNERTICNKNTNNKSSSIYIPGTQSIIPVYRNWKRVFIFDEFN